MRTHSFWLRLILFCLAVWPVAAQASPPAVTVGVSPNTATLTVGGIQQFTAQVSGATNTRVTWAVNGITGGNSTVGTITADGGRYTAPSVPPSGATVTITATSVADTTARNTATATIVYRTPSIASVTPTPVAVGPFTLTVNGANYINGAQVRWNGAALPTTYVSATRLTATGNATQAGTAQVTVANPGPSSVSPAFSVPVIVVFTVSVTPASVAVNVGATKQLQVSNTHPSNQAVTWLVNGVAGGNANVGTISGNGLYTAPATLPAGGGVTVTARSNADNTTSGAAQVTVQDPQLITYGRFLEQCTFGPTANEMAYVRQIGIPAYLDDQLNKPESAWPAPAGSTVQQAMYAFFVNASTGQDQLRQRVIYALSEIIVISRNKNTNGNELMPWLQILSRNALGNYRTLLREITLDASMGKYLDLVNSTRANATSSPNENYPREVMQLFSLGLYRLNPDGSLQLDANGQPIPTYTQADVQQLARALTGWTYPTTPGRTPTNSLNGSYYHGPMEARPLYHDPGSKTFLGATLPANQSMTQDLDAVIDVLFNHPNIAPFVATRLIRALVTSNPSPAYIARVSAVFDNNGQGVRGDLKAVVRAILLDPEARNDNPPPTFGRLRSALQQTIATMRTLNATVPAQTSPTQGLIFSWRFDLEFDEGILNANSVFGHYSPLFRIPRSALFGPEFQIYTPTTAIYRANFIYNLIRNQEGVPVDISPYVALAANNNALINALDNQMLFGRMTPATRNALATMLPTQPDNTQKALAALYLVLTSGEYLMQR